MADSRVGPVHHPSEARLLDYASGATREPVALLIATHLALCHSCRRKVGELEAVGGALLESLPAEPVKDDSFARLLARLDRPETTDPAAPVRSPGDAVLPQPLRDYVGRLDQVAWRRLGPIAQVRLLPGFEGITTRLVRIRPAAAMPRHTHAGSELSLVLQGGFSDATGHYRRGDVAEADSAVDHRPITDADEECLCLAVLDAPVRLTGRLGRLLNPFIRS
jgi:putative transcriptional regulator